MFEGDIKGLELAGLLRTLNDRLSAQGRVIKLRDGRGRIRSLVNFASNDYLGLSMHPRTIKAAQDAAQKYGAGAGASRLLSGGCPLHARLEEQTARFKSTESSVLFNSGYAANTGLLPAIAQHGDEIFSDELNHASIVDGCRISRAKTTVYRHCDLDQLEGLLKKSRAMRKIIVTDTIFSMDGDIAPVGHLAALSHRYGAVLYLDEAHATGVLGGGRGGLEHFGIRPGEGIIQMGTYSKALGSVGAFCASDKGTATWALNRARSFLYSTALPPACAASSIAAIGILEKDRSLVTSLHANITYIREKLTACGMCSGQAQTPIIPVMLKDPDTAVMVSAYLYKHGFYAPAIRPPTVKTPRIRISVTAMHTEEDLKALSELLLESASGIA